VISRRLALNVRATSFGRQRCVVSRLDFLAAALALVGVLLLGILQGILLAALASILPKTMMWSTHSRRIDPISRSAKPFCQGEAGAVMDLFVVPTIGFNLLYGRSTRSCQRKPTLCQRTSVSGRMMVRTPRIDGNQRYSRIAISGSCVTVGGLSPSTKD
jgi:hypothetical protein